MIARNWVRLLSSWKNIKLLRIYVQFKNTLSHYRFYENQRAFKSVPFLVERHVYPQYSFSDYNNRRIHFCAYYQKEEIN